MSLTSTALRVAAAEMRRLALAMDETTAAQQQLVARAVERCAIDVARMETQLDEITQQSINTSKVLADIGRRV